jgi:hypothetical protein
MSSIENEYNQQQEEDYQEFLDFKERRDRERGIVEGHPIGDTLHPKTVKSYSKLGLPTPDSVYYASRRAEERALKMHKALAIEKGEKFEEKKTITRVYRLKDKDTGKEFLTWSELIEFSDRMDNPHSLNYDRCGTHEEAIGNVRKDIHMKVIGGQVTGINVIFDKEWSPKEFEALMKQHQGQPKQTEFVVGFTKNHGRNSLFSEGDKIYSIKNAEDFKTAKHEDLIQLAQRGLSGREPSLKKLSQPIADDPRDSLYKKERGYLDPGAISYTQNSYR